MFKYVMHPSEIEAISQVADYCEALWGLCQSSLSQVAVTRELTWSV